MKIIPVMDRKKTCRHTRPPARECACKDSCWIALWTRASALRKPDQCRPALSKRWQHKIPKWVQRYQRKLKPVAAAFVLAQLYERGAVAKNAIYFLEPVLNPDLRQ